MTVPALIEFEGGALIADLLSDAQTTRAIELTQHAVEDGSLITDHAIRQPMTLELTLVQTETPLAIEDGFEVISQDLDYAVRATGTQTTQLVVAKKEFRPTSLLALTGAIQSALFDGQAPSVTGLKADGALGSASLRVSVLAADSPKDRINAFEDALVGLMLAVQPCIVTIKGRALPDLVITTVARTDAAGQVGCARFRVAMQTIATVETQTVDLPPVPKATKPKDRGTKPTKPASEKVRDKTLTLGLLQGAGLVE